MQAKKGKKIVTLQQRIDNYLHRIYNELVETGKVNVDFDTWIDSVVMEEEVENQD